MKIMSEYCTYCSPCGWSDQSGTGKHFEYVFYFKLLQPERRKFNNK